MKQQEKIKHVVYLPQFLSGKVFYTNVREYLHIKHTFQKKHDFGKSTMETQGKGVKYTVKTPDVVLLSLFLTLNIFHGF